MVTVGVRVKGSGKLTTRLPFSSTGNPVTGKCRHPVGKKLVDGVELDIKKGVKGPNGTVFTIEGTERTLHQIIEHERGDRGEGKAAKMTLLILGSQTCPTFMEKLPEVMKIVKPLVEKGLLSVLLIYIREAHPTDGWDNDEDSPLPKLAQTHTMEARMAAAKQFRDSAARLLEGVTLLVDDPNTNALDVAYEAAPTRLVLLDDGNRVAHCTGQAPLQYDLKKFAEDMAYIAMIMDD